MSGPNQHHIPRFLQRACGVKPKGKAPKQIWVYQRDEEPSLEDIAETAAEDHFYSPPAEDGVVTLDDRITVAEDKVAKQFNAIRDLPVGSTVDAETAADLVTHLAPRSRHVRSSMASAFYQLITGVNDVIAEPDQLEQLLGLDQEQPNERFGEKLRDGLADMPQIEAIGIPAPVLERVAFYVAKEQFDSTVDNSIAAYGSMLTQWAVNSEPMVRDSHNRALDGLAEGPNPRRDHLATFAWSIKAGPEDGVILPDCVALAYAPKAPALPLMFVGKDMDAVVMPLSRTRLLVGRLASAAAPNVTIWNEEAAACSQEFFLASTDQHADLNRLIGTRAAVYFDDAMRGAFESHFPQRTATEDAEEDSVGLGPAPVAEDLQFSCDISCYDFGDAELHRRVADACVPIIRGLARALPLSRLDGITFAIDYPAALRAIDRGRPNLPPAETSLSGEVGGIGRTIVVVRDGRVKGRLIFNAPVVEYLLSEDADTVAWAIQMMVHQLTLVGMTELIERALPGTMLRPIEDSFQGALYREVHDALNGYVAARMSGYFADKSELAALYRDRLVRALDFMKIEIEKARAVYARDTDMEALLAIAMPAVGQSLLCAAEFLGHCETADERILDEDGKLAAALNGTGLAHWLADYGRDLERFYRRLGAWRSLDEFLAFTRHVERLLWSVGLFPWQSPEGDRVEVLLPADAGALVEQR